MKVVICGAGIGGLALAHQLDALGWEVVLVEQAPGPREQGYMMDFFGPGYDAAEAMGVLPRLRELSYQIGEASYVDDGGRRRAGLDYDQFTRIARGRLISIMRPDLERALREHLGGQVDARFGTSVAEVDNQPDRVRVGLTDGTRLDADLLVGADGIHSAVRGLVFGAEERFLRYLGLHTAAYTFTDSEIHQRLHGRFCLTDTLDRQVGLYGLRTGLVAVFTVHRSADPTLPADPRAALRAEYGSLNGIVPQALAHCPPGEDVYYDQVAQIELPHWSRGRVTLVGDACYAVSLLAGQGASLAVAGAYLLADQLVRTGSVEDALRRYEQLWRPIVTHRQTVARSVAQWFVPRSRLRRQVRRTALHLARLPGADRFLAAAMIGKPTTVIQDLTQRSPR
ncbi:FAD-dependent monooxygenase [Actinophytocola sp.]|uniref:FAD-dependent monooxygenase n=1 Tax=Actinophytocola sp. TaxID=1872138 RepID=UPI002D8072D0|nr:FAD-dependent monooxygenase [Actinophytocola sp.]HET9142456.1 FAD-dependent monooxygenase [Actinophytocola sp.]